MRFVGFVMAFMLAAAAASGQPSNVTLIVPGTADPWLAGQTPGTTASGGDTAPAQSPVQVTGIPITPGQPVRFFAAGRVTSQSGGSADGPPGNATLIVSHLGGQENAISNISAPLGSLVGVFLNDRLPLFTPVPPGLDFTSAVSRNYISLAPAIQQVFYIGDGHSGGNVQQIVPPAGATRLFLGTMDSSRWTNHTGAFTVIVETNVPATGAICTITPRNNLLPFHHSAAHLAGLFPDHFVTVAVSSDGASAGNVSVTINASRPIFTLTSGSPATLSAIVSATDAAGRAIFSINPPTPLASERTDLVAQGSAGGRDFRCTGTLVTGIGFGLESIGNVVGGGISGSTSAFPIASVPASGAVPARFERHWMEIMRIAMNDPDLAERGSAALREFGPALGRLMAGEPVEINASRAKELSALVARFSAAASPELRGLIDELRAKARVATVAASPKPAPKTNPVAGPTSAAQKLLAKMPIAFEPGRDHGFLARGPGFTLSLSNNGAALSTGSGEMLRMRFRGARSGVRITPLDPLPGRSNYLEGNQPARWRRDVPQYARVKYENIYPGVDAVFHGAAGEMEFDFVVAPGADTSPIALLFEGAEQLQLDDSGDSFLRYGPARFRLRKPVLYQETAGVRQSAEGRYVRRSDKELGFEIGAYDVTRPLVIDPVLSYASYVGGGKDDSGLAIAVDLLGNTYVAGSTASSFGGNSLKPAGSLVSNGDAFVIKLNPAATAPVYTTYIGGNGHSGALGIAVDLSGNVFLTGSTDAADFPIVQPFQRNFGGGSRSLGVDAFVLKLNPAGSTLLYSTYLGGTGGDVGRAIAIDAVGNAYIAGLTTSPNFPLVTPLQGTFRGGRRLGCDAFLTKLNPTGTQLIYSTLLGGSEDDIASGVAVDSAGAAFVTGVTYSADFPIRNALLPAIRGGADAFVTGINAAGTGFLYSTYLGGSGDDFATAIAVDRSSNVYLTGLTGSADFPIVNAVQPKPGSSDSLGFDAFAMKITPDNGAIAWSTYLGGSGNDFGLAIAVGSDGSAYIGGETDSANFPLTAPLQSAFGGLIDGFVVKLNPDGSAVTYSTFAGGSGHDSVAALAVDANGALYTAGSSTSADLSVSFGTYQADNQGRSDVVVMKLADGASSTIVTVSAASIRTGPSAPDSIVSGFGQGFAASFERALTLPLPTVLAGVSVRVKDSAGVERQASLYAAAASQINFLIPADSANGLAQVTVTGAGGATLASGTVRINSVAPALFTANASGRGVAAAIATRISADRTTASGLVFQCGSVPGSCIGSPIDVDTPGDSIFISLYGTGIKRRSSLDAVKVTIAGQDVPVSFAGAQSESPGLDQVNIGPLPRTLVGRGVVDLILTVDGVRANTVTLTIR